MSEAAITLKNFFETARDGRLTAIKCGRCGNLEIPPKEFCDACGQRDWRPTPLSGDGTIASYTVIRVAPTKHAGDAPYAVAVVKLREGVSLFGRVVDVALERLAVGMPVRFRPLVIRNQTALGFGPPDERRRRDTISRAVWHEARDRSVPVTTTPPTV